MEVARFTPEEEQMIQAEFDALLDDYAHTKHRQKVDIITQAFEFANRAHYGVRRLSGEPYMMHPLAVARICIREIGLGSTSICAALMHDVVEDTDYTVEDIERLFNYKIAHIVEGLTKISGGIFGDKASEQAENFRKLLLTMSDDVRVVLIKIADRLHNMRTLSAQPKEKQYKIAGETQYIYAPLAHRLGLFPIKTELENLAFQYEHPDTYEEIRRKIEERKNEQLLQFDAFAEPIRKKLDEMGYQYSITARIKSPFSVWKKMTTKNIPFEDVYDLLAVRLVFTPHTDTSEREQCWVIYSAITDIYKPHPERIRDWISTPKSNGYEALHITVMADKGQWVEVQIRTERMHELAERGYAAHWRYKNDEGSEKENQLDKWLQNIKEIIAHPEQDAMDFLDTFKLNLFAEEVFVFTRTGDIRTMPLGSTILDFAYMLHTELGEHVIGAKVNHKLVGISYVLQSGDLIEVLTSEKSHPVSEWLEIATTAKAKSRIQDWFKREDKRYAKEGEELFLGKVDKMYGVKQGVQSANAPSRESSEYIAYRDMVLMKVLNHYGLTKPEALYSAIGKGAIVVDGLEAIVFPKKSIWQRMFGGDDQDESAQSAAKDQSAVSSVPKVKGTIILTDDNIGKEFILSKCCHPIPGDEVMGYKADDGKVYIHKQDCPTAQRIKTSQGKRVVAAKWDTHRVQSFMETIEIEGIDHMGVFIQVLHIISEQFNINLHEVHVTTEDGIFKGRIGIYIYDRKEMQELFAALKEIPDVTSARRIES